MRRPFTKQTALANALTKSSLSWAVRKGEIQHLGRDMYLRGREPASPIEIAASVVVATGGVAFGTFAASLYGLDLVSLQMPYAALPARASRKGTCRVQLEQNAITFVRGYRCTVGTQTMLDLAAVLDDLKWEQSLESALRKKLTSIHELERALEQRRIGNARIRRVLKLRPDKAPPTESLLETHAIQLMRNDPLLPVPTRQLEIRNRYDRFEARVDLAFPDEGVFFELDGRQHEDQPLYDANRQTRVVGATGWLVGRFTWDEIVDKPVSTLRRMADLFFAAKSINRAS